MDEPTENLKPMQLPPKKKSLAVPLLIGLVVVLVASCGYVGWLWWTANEDKTKLQNENKELQTQVQSLRNQVAADNADQAAEEEPCDGTITAELKANIKDAVTSKNLAALAGYMTNPVSVILAASEGLGDRTPDQAVVDMEYLNGGTAPWDFDLSPATLATYEAGFYKDYFDNNTVVGKSVDDYVVSVDFDDCAKINKVFMVSNEDLLLP